MVYSKPLFWRHSFELPEPKTKIRKDQLVNTRVSTGIERSSRKTYSLTEGMKALLESTFYSLILTP